MGSYDGSQDSRDALSETIAGTLDNLSNAQTSILNVVASISARMNTLKSTQALHEDAGWLIEMCFQTFVTLIMPKRQPVSHSKHSSTSCTAVFYSCQSIDIVFPALVYFQIGYLESGNPRVAAFLFIAPIFLYGSILSVWAAMLSH